MAFRTPSRISTVGSGPESLVDAVRSLAERRPEDCAFRFLDSRGAESGMLTFAGLDEAARAVAAGIRRETGGEAGARVLVLQPPGLDYVTTFLGCLYAGAVAVTSYPKLLTRNRERLAALVADCGPQLAVTSGEATKAADRMAAEDGELPGVGRFDAAELRGDPDSWRPPPAGPQDLAFLQYTSGTTAAPRGVMVTHGNLMANSAVLSGRLGYRPGEARMVSWLPPYHDMGLIGGIIQPLYVGFECVLMAPATFASDPFQWLRALSEYGGTASFAPTFALDLCVDRISEEQRRTLDLSAWDNLVVGAETVRADAVERFRKAFAPCGVRPELVCGGYGLAESTLAVTAAPPAAEPALLDVSAAALQARRLAEPEHAEDRRTLVGCGPSVDDAQRLLVVDPDSGVPCSPDEIGEIWVSGPSVAAGYWEREEATERTFRARTRDGQGPFLRTGDLGFTRDGELFVCGRIKDLVIVNGRNLYPQDIEACAGTAHAGIRRNLCAAAGLPAEDGTAERLLVVAEVERHLPEDELPAVAEAVRAAVAEEFEARVHAVSLIRAASMPRTTSGKIQRHACARDFLSGELAELHRWTAGADETGDRATAAPQVRPSTGASPLRDLVLGLDPALRGPVVESDLRRRLGLSPDHSATAALVASGIDSLRAFELLHRLEKEYAVRLPLTDVLDTSLAGLTGALLDGLAAPEPACDAATPAPPDAAAVAPSPDDRHEPFPLTDLQQAYFAGRSASYRLGGVSTHFYAEFDAPHRLDTGRLLDALETVVRRHDMLRAVVTPDGEQRVLPAEETGPVPVPRHDLTTAGPEAVRTHLASVRERLSHQVLPLGRWPLFALEISELPDGRRRLHFGLDLLIADVRSAQILFREWEACYRDAEAARRLPELPVSFRELVLAERSAQQGPRHRRARAYWQQRIPGLPPAPRLPLAPPTGSGPHRFHRLSDRLPAPTWDAVRELAAEHGLTPSTALLAAYACTLGAWSGTGRFTLHVTLFNRPTEPAGTDRVIGDFTSVTLLEVDLTEGEGTASFADVARRIQRRLWEDLDHREYSAVQVLRDLRRMRGDEADLFAAPVVFTSGRGHGGADEDDDLPTSWLGETAFAVSQTPQVVLDHQVFERDGALLLSWDAVLELFPGQVAQDMFRSYVALLGSLADSAAWRRAARPAVPEHAAVVARANDTAGPLPDGPLHGPLLEQARRRPDAVAVVAGEERLTYGRLLAHAHRIAGELRDGPPRRGRLVGVAMEKSAEQIVAVLAVLLSGAAYLPIDPQLPAERRHFLAEHGGLDLVLTAPDSGETWPQGVRRLTVDLTAPAPDDVFEETWTGDPTDLAYVVFTSGSTGVPKGVMVSHRAASNTCADINERFRVSTDDTVLGLSSLSFDLSVWDVFGVLGAGGTLVLPEPSARRDPARWRYLLDEHRVTLWNSVPALMRMYAEHLEGERHRGPLRLALLSGDWIPTDLPGRLHRLAPGIEVVSLGGATEAAVWSVCHPVPTGSTAPAPGWDSVPYGTALRNQTVHVLDDRMLPCQPWVTGEIHLGGAGLADGYWRDPERTAAAFVTDPHTGRRLYRTGDLGRWRPEGVVEFLGRRDGQVKVGGHRVELGEVEALLGRHEDVQTAVAVAPGDRNRRTLVAAVLPTPAAREACAPGELADRVRRYALRHLPAYMVPAALTVVDSMPLTANGKVDRTAVAAALATTAEQPAAAPGAPASRLAQRVLRVTIEASGGPVSPARSFFEQGIDSVTLVRLHRLLRVELDRDVPLTALFENPSVNALAAALEAAETGTPAAGDDPLDRARAAARRKRGARRRGRQQTDQQNEQEQPA